MFSKQDASGFGGTRFKFRETGITKSKFYYVRRQYSKIARNRFNPVVEAKRFEGVFLCRKVC